MIESVLAAEQAAIAAGAAACGFTCQCHGGYTCLRTDPHDRSPHVGRQPDGALVQWGVDECPTPEQLAAIEAEAAKVRAAATRALFDSIDPALLVQLLREQLQKDGGHL